MLISYALATHRRVAAVCAIMAGGFPVFALSAHAQDVLSPSLPPAPLSISAEGALDMRARLPTTGSLTTQVHSGYLRLLAGASPDTGANTAVPNLHLFAINQYGYLRWQEASIEKEFPVRTGDSETSSRLPNRIQAGILRLPFGIYDYRETYASGLIDYPLPRVDYAYDAVDWGVPGAQWSGGTSAIQGDVAAFSGSAAGLWGNFNHASGIAGRAQFFAPPNAILGVSGWNGSLSPSPASPSRPVHLFGIDARYTLSHLLLRGEWMGGALADARRLRGGYLDVYYRLPGIESVTLVGRLEALRPDDNVPEARQITLGVRWIAAPDWALSANWRRNNIAQAYSFTWTPPAEGRGEALFQILRTFRFAAPAPR